ncbi:hypothetical protein BIV57_10510 [Mangrovactinospora gilvigrisea]|uniref:PspA-associated domain-containing protein n=1 Tax=Mangrovactinospora gilvigrisea TaxID=1428644 RepID=A0A1J7BFU3_9ACTN|nr:hypothetical protein [Mangrovactinospora gilvigrisea]OIV37547.1 hypothetical protein BIV57_10510 [Mangrovactinospora gilvigrisea]
MIVRIMGEGQVDVAESQFGRLNELDDELLSALEEGAEPRFREVLGRLLAAVREVGTPLAADALEPSELILPNGDATIDDVRKMLRDDGLIPG